MQSLKAESARNIARGTWIVSPSLAERETRYVAMIARALEEVDARHNVQPTVRIASQSPVGSVIPPWNRSLRKDHQVPANVRRGPSRYQE